MELYKGAVNREQLTTIGQFLERNHVTRLPVVTAASQRAVALLHDYGLAHGLASLMRSLLRLSWRATLPWSRAICAIFGSFPGYAWSLRRIVCPSLTPPKRGSSLASPSAHERFLTEDPHGPQRELE